MNGEAESLVREVAKQVPALLVNAFIVWMFLGFMRSISADMSAVQNKATEALHENTGTLGEVAEALRGLTR